MSMRVVAPLVARVCLVASLLLLACTTPSARAEDVPPVCTGSCTVYVPAIKNAPSAPSLLNPNTDTIESVAPVLTWTVVTTGTYRVQLSAKADLSSPVVNTTVSLGTVAPNASYISTFNLSSATRYYWRVGVRPQDTTTYIYSATQTFLTGTRSNLPTPPATNLLTPQPNEKVSFATATASWEAVEGATYYRVKVVEAVAGKNFDTGPTAFSQIVAGTITSVPITGLEPGKTYYWSVRVLNQYAWSEYAATRTFTTTP